MKPKLLLCLALVLSGLLFGAPPSNADTSVPIVAAPAMHESPEPKIKDLGLWDDAFRFEDLDSVILRRGDEMFSYSLVDSDLKKIHPVSGMVGSRISDGVKWGTHQWLFCQSDATLPFAVDLSTGQKVSFPIPGVKSPGTEGPAIHAVIIAGSEGGTLVEIRGDSVAGWPRDGNRSLFFWMSLESGKMTALPIGWDLNYFSADQERAVFENISTNAMMYRPWVTVAMATGEETVELPDQTKGLWSEPPMEFWQVSSPQGYQFKNRRDVWPLRTSRTPMKQLHPQPGRGFIDDRFAGLSVNGIDYPLALTNAERTRCVDAKSAGNLAAFTLQPDGGSGNSLWITQLGQPDPPVLLASNCDFELLGEHRCALIARNGMQASCPQGVVYDVESNTAWNILDGLPLWTNTLAVLSGTADKSKTHLPQTASGIGPMVSLRMVPGFGSARYPAQVLCLFSSMNVVPAYMTSRSPESRQFILLTAQGERYQIKLPKDLGDLMFEREFWLHNSGKLVICHHEPPSENSPHGQFHLIVATLDHQP